MDIVLADLNIDGRMVKALMHAPKNGFFYVIDRENGELVSAAPFTETTWATSVDPASGRPVEVPGARYENGPAFVSPGPIGGHNWHAMSYNPATGLAYFPAIHLSYRFSDESIDLDAWRSPLRGTGTGVRTTRLGSSRPDGVLGSLQAWDPVRQQRAWEVPLDGMWHAGTLTTAGNLVFQGSATGELAAYDAETGAELWRFNAGSGISAPPITYAVDGRQYLALLVGWGGAYAGVGGRISADQGWAYGVHPRRLIAFSLEGAASLPPSPPPRVPAPLEAPHFEVDAGLAQQGALEFGGVCSACHGGGAVSSGMAPDLRASGLVLAAGAFANIVRDGRTERGMPDYPELTDQQLTALRHYIRQQAELELAGR